MNSKVDRSGAYMARFLAKQVAARGWAPRCLVQLAYAIGEPEPVSFLVAAAGCTDDRNADIAAALREEFDLTPAGIMACLDLKRPSVSLPPLEASLWVVAPGHLPLASCVVAADH